MVPGISVGMEEPFVRCLSVGQFKAETVMERSLLCAALGPVHGSRILVAVGFLTITAIMTS